MFGMNIKSLTALFTIEKTLQDLMRLVYLFHLKVNTLKMKCFRTIFKHHLFLNVLFLLQKTYYKSIVNMLKGDHVKFKKFNPYHAEFHKWKNPPSNFGTIHYHFRDIKMKT